jgi:chorismate-pyruvate lyase
MLGYKPFELGVKNEEQDFLNKLGTDDFTDEELDSMPIGKIMQVENAEYEKELEDELAEEQSELEKEKEEAAAERSERKKLYE